MRNHKGRSPRATRAHSKGKEEQGEPAAAAAVDRAEKKKRARAAKREREREREDREPASRHARERAADRLPRTLEKKEQEPPKEVK